MHLYVGDITLKKVLYFQENAQRKQFKKSHRKESDHILEYYRLYEERKEICPDITVRGYQEKYVSYLT